MRNHREPTYRFGPFLLDAWRAELRCGDDAIDLRPKPFRVLLYLLRNRDRAVPKAELLDELWPGVAVSETALTTAIKYIRQALTADTPGSTWIESRRGVGYRFVGEVTERESHTTPQAPAPEPAASEDWVDREAPTAAMERWSRELEQGRGCVASIRGEAGIGKSRVLAEISRRSGARGWRVASAWCPEDSATPPYWPWTQLLRELGRGAGWGAGPPAPALRALVAPLVPEWSNSREMPPPEARFEVFDAVVQLLRELAASGPLVLLIDDLHGADPSSLRLLAFTAREIASSPVLIASSLREPAGEQSPALRQTLGGLARQVHAEDLRLEHWSDPEVARLAALLPVDLSPEQVGGIAARAAGNPFYARELMLREHDRSAPAAPSPAEAEAQVPAPVRDALRARMERLAPMGRAALATAAVIGRSFSLRVLSRAVGLQEEELAESLAEAVDEGLLRDALREYRFTHAIVREAILADIARPQLAKLHLKVAESLEDDPLGGDPERLASLFGRAEGSHLRAAAYARRAGESAMAALAFESAVLHFERALGALEVDESPAPLTRCDLLVELGRARMLAGEPQPIVRTTLLEAAEIASGLGDGDAMARALLAFQNLPSGAAELIDHTRIERTEEAIRLRGDREDETAVRLLCNQALQRLRLSREEAEEILDRAEKISNGIGHPAARAAVLHARIMLGDSRTAPARMRALCDELAETADASKLWELSAVARWRGALASLAGGSGEVPAQLDRLSEFLSRHPVGRARAHVPRIRSLLALLEGDLLRAEQLLQEATDLAERMHNPVLRSMCLVMRSALLREQGQSHTMLAIYQAMRQQTPEAIFVRCALADTLARTGRMKEAREEFSQLGDPEDAAGFVGGNPALYLCFLAETCHRLEDRGRAEELYPRLVAYRDRHAVESQGTIALGSAERYAGLLAELCGEVELAIEHFERAIAANEAAGAALWAEHTRVDWARLLLRRSEGADRDAAAALLERSGRFAALQDLSELRERVERARIEGQGALPFPKRGRVS